MNEALKLKRIAATVLVLAPLLAACASPNLVDLSRRDPGIGNKHEPANVVPENSQGGLSASSQTCNAVEPLVSPEVSDETINQFYDATSEAIELIAAQDPKGELAKLRADHKDLVLNMMNNLSSANWALIQSLFPAEVNSAQDVSSCFPALAKSAMIANKDTVMNLSLNEAELPRGGQELQKQAQILASATLFEAQANGLIFLNEIKYQKEIGEALTSASILAQISKANSDLLMVKGNLSQEDLTTVSAYQDLALSIKEKTDNLIPVFSRIDKEELFAVDENKAEMVFNNFVARWQSQPPHTMEEFDRLINDPIFKVPFLELLTSKYGSAVVGEEMFERAAELIKKLPMQDYSIVLPNQFKIQSIYSDGKYLNVTGNAFTAQFNPADFGAKNPDELQFAKYVIFNVADETGNSKDVVGAHIVYNGQQYIQFLDWSGEVTGGVTGRRVASSREEVFGSNFPRVLSVSTLENGKLQINLPENNQNFKFTQLLFKSNEISFDGVRSSLLVPKVFQMVFLGEPNLATKLLRSGVPELDADDISFHQVVSIPENTPLIYYDHGEIAGVMNDSAQIVPIDTRAFNNVVGLLEYKDTKGEEKGIDIIVLRHIGRDNEVWVGVPKNAVETITTRASAEEFGQNFPLYNLSLFLDLWPVDDTGLSVYSLGKPVEGNRIPQTLGRAIVYDKDYGALVRPFKWREIAGGPLLTEYDMFGQGVNFFQSTAEGKSPIPMPWVSYPKTWGPYNYKVIGSGYDLLVSIKIDKGILKAQMAYLGLWGGAKYGPGIREALDLGVDPWSDLLHQEIMEKTSQQFNVWGWVTTE